MGEVWIIFVFIKREGMGGGRWMFYVYEVIYVIYVKGRRRRGVSE